jgi:hypothetical protein
VFSVFSNSDMNSSRKRLDLLRLVNKTVGCLEVFFEICSQYFLENNELLLVVRQNLAIRTSYTEVFS